MVSSPPADVVTCRLGKATSAEQDSHTQSSFKTSLTTSKGQKELPPASDLPSLVPSHPRNALLLLMHRECCNNGSSPALISFPRQGQTRPKS